MASQSFGHTTSMNNRPHRSRAIRLAWLTSLVVLIGGCEAPPSEHPPPINTLDNPAPTNAQLPNIIAGGKGAPLILSWIETQGENTHRLRYSTWSPKTHWSASETVATGGDWFVNWADFPAVYAVDSDRLAAHWLKRSGPDTYAYDVITRQRIDGVWRASRSPHLDGTQTEHGFVSFYSIGGQPALAWLDGRHTGSSGGDHASHADSSGSMALRTRTLSSTPTPLIEHSTLLDDRVCDCCQTAAVNTDSGAIIFYRDRSPDEVRDIAYVRYDYSSKTWSPPRALHRDNWVINGCPVNGPQAAAQGQTIAVAWFTATPTPRVQLAMSDDGGAQFDAPVLVSDANPLGRVSIGITPSGRVMVGWIETQRDNAVLKTTLYTPQGHKIRTLDIATVSSTRRSGFPRLGVVDEHTALIVWTDWQGGTSHVRTATVALPPAQDDTH